MHVSLSITYQEFNISTDSYQFAWEVGIYSTNSNNKMFHNMVMTKTKTLYTFTFNL